MTITTKKILVPLDGSKNSMKGLNNALAKPIDAEIKAVYDLKWNMDKKNGELN